MQKQIIRSAFLALGALAASSCTWVAPDEGGVAVRVAYSNDEIAPCARLGEITVSVRLWKRPQVKPGGRYRVGAGLIEVDAIELLPFAAITEEDVRRAGELDRETLRELAAHAGPIGEDTLVYRIELHPVVE